MQRWQTDEALITTPSPDMKEADHFQPLSQYIVCRMCWCSPYFLLTKPALCMANVIVENIHVCCSVSTRSSVRMDTVCWQIIRHEEISFQVQALYRPVSENKLQELNPETRQRWICFLNLSFVQLPSCFLGLSTREKKTSSMLRLTSWHSELVSAGCRV